MTSVIYDRGQTVVPAKLRKKLGWTPGTTLDWMVSDNGLKVVRMEVPKPRKKTTFLEGLKLLGSLPFAPRSTEKVAPPSPDAL